MTYRSMHYYDERRYFFTAFAVIIILTGSGCASNTIDEAVPISAISEPLPAPVNSVGEPAAAAPNPIVPTTTTKAVATVPVASPNVAAPQSTGQYPNINVVPTGETAQLSDAETAATRAALEGEVQVQQQRGESSEDYLARLRKLQRLGSTHAAATLHQIEKSQ